MKKQFQSLTEKGRWLIATLTLLFTLGIGQMWADLTAHIPGVYEKATNKGGYGCTLTTVASGENAGTFEVYYFSAQSKYSENTTVYNEGTKQQYRLMCADGDSEYQLINRNGTSTFTASCDWIEMAYEVTGFSKSDYTFGSNKFNEFFEITPNGGNTGITKTCYIKPKNGDVLTLKVSGYVEFAILGNDNGSSKYMTISVDGGTPTSWKSNTLSRRAVSLTTEEHTIVVACVGNSANAFYGFSLKLPSCDATAPGNISKGALSAGILTLQVADDPKTGDEFYWQTSATGTTKNKTGENINFGKTYQVSAAGTYYIRSYNTSDDCWSETKSITITATDLVSNYTVKYMDGTTELGSEAVEVGEHPTGSGITTPTKDCYTFAGWDPALSGVSGSDGDEIEVNATWTPKYASTLDFAAVTIAGTTGANPIGTFLASGNMVASNLGSNSGWETSTAKSGFIGYKVKNTNAVIKFLVKAGKEVEITLGSVGAAAKLNKGGVESEIAKKSGDNEQTVIPAFVAESDMLVTITTNASSNSTVTLKKISIVDPAPKYTVTYALNGATGTTPTEVDHKAGEKFNLHDGATGITAPANKTFVNWKDQDDNEFAGGAEYTMPGENVTLTAQWAGDVYTVKFMDGETVLDTKVVEVGSHPTDIEHPTKPLYTFAAWQLSGSDVVLDNVNGTKDATVILTARWAVAYASNVNFKEAATQALGVETALNTYHYASDAGDISFEEKGLKIKTNAARFYFNVAPGKVAEIKFGNISGATYSVDGGAETLTSSQLKATYSASAQSCVMTMTTAAYNIVEKVTIHDPYQVSFDANDGDPVDAQYGYPSVTLPSASKGTDSFLGWFIGEDKIGEAGDSYTPTADVELVAHWEAVSTDTRIKALTYAIGAGTPVNIYEADKNTFNVVLPYAKSYDAITVATTPNHANASIKEGASLTVSSLPGSATFTIVAQSGAEADYTVNFSMGPKDGVCLIKGNVGNDSFVIDEEASLLSGTTYKNAVKSASTKYPDDETGLVGWKFNSKGAYLGFTLDGTETFQENDVVEAYITYIDGGDKLRVFTDHADAAMLKEGDDLVLGVNKLLLPATSTQTLYLYRSPDGGTYQNWNPRVAYFAVYRAMDPMLTAMTIDGRTVTINEDAKTATVTIPYESDLDNLTIAKTIVWNAPATENSIVVNGGSAWVIGENTYKMTDKDGDATTYTITVARDVLKHTVSFNTHGGSAVASVEIEHNTYLTSVPNDPSKEDYIFQYWSLTDGGEEVDITTVQITENKEFHAVWASDGGIKLLNGSAVNHTNFITAVTADETVEFKGNTVNYAKFSGTCGSVSNVKDLTRVIAYNATTNKTKIRISAHNNSTSARNILVKGLVEGADAAVDLATIALGNKEDKVSDWIEFDNAANRTIYIMVGSSAGDVYFTQVKVIESGETTLKRAGDAGYSLNFNQGRFFGVKDVTAHFEGMDVEVESSDCQPLNTSVVKLASSSMSFDVAAPVTLTVTTNNSNTYYVTKGAAGTDNETAYKGASDFDLTAGTWYITGGASNVEVKSIAFAAPKCAEPVIDNDPESNTNFGPGNLTASVTAHATDGATLAYQWYDASDDSEVSGATDATLTTTTEGTYYVIITASKAGYDDRSVQSANATLGYRDLTIATLSALSYGGTAIALEADKYEYRVDLPEGTTDVPALAATATQAAYGATAVPTDATEFVEYEAVSTVLVTAEDGVTTQTYTVHFYVDHIYTALVDVTESTTWNWTGSDDVTINDVANKGLILANYIDGLNFEKIEGKEGERARRNQNGGCYQGTQLHFNTTVYGKVKIYFRAPSSGDNCTIYVNNNGKRMNVGNRGNSFGWSKEVVVKGDVVIEMVKDGGGDTRVQQIVFTQVAPDYTRNVSNNIGTLCVDHNVLAGGFVGATFYQIASRNEIYNDKIDFEEVGESEELVAGQPYIFQSTTGRIDLFYGATAVTEPEAVRGMHGWFDAAAPIDPDKYDMLGITEENKSDILYIAQNKLWNCEDLTELKVVNNRAYIVMSEVPTYAEYQAAQTSNPAPRRRVTLGKDATQTTTGVENLNASEQPVKLLINGQIFILRGEKMFDATGRLVK